LLAGTDSPDIPGMFPGYSIHDDLRTLVESGLSPFQALSAATRTPGEFVSKTIPNSQRFGVVSQDYRADLVLVPGNPLQDLQVLKSPLGVMRAGRWLPSNELFELLQAQKRKPVR
jgi:imidazolonepropionase-like amidohydrolase